jgi:hypothetical protein
LELKHANDLLHVVMCHLLPKSRPELGSIYLGLTTLLQKEIEWPRIDPKSAFAPVM